MTDLSDARPTPAVPAIGLFTRVAALLGAATATAAFALARRSALRRSDRIARAEQVIAAASRREDARGVVDRLLR